jgi:hypothetical protein
MKLSASIEFVWALASQEAAAGGHGVIEPEHFLAAVLKFAELTPDQAQELIPDPAVSPHILGEVDAVRGELAGWALSARDLRRLVRLVVGQGPGFAGGHMHRSGAVEQLAARA